MDDLNSALYDFVFFLGGLLLFIWLLRQLFVLKHLQSLSRAVRTSSIVLLDELIVAGQRITTDAIRSILSKKKRIYTYDVEPLAITSSIHQARLIDRAGDAECQLTVNVCSRLACRVDVFVGVPRSLLSLLFDDHLAFRRRPQAPSTAETKHARAIHKQVQPSLHTPAPALLSSKEFSCHSAQTQAEATMSTALTFVLPRVSVQKAVNDPSLLPVLVLLTPIPASTPPSAAAARKSRLSAASPQPHLIIEMSPTSASSPKLQRWLSSHPHPPSPQLQSLTLLTGTGVGEDGLMALCVHSTLLLSPSPPFVYRCDELFGLQDEPDCLVCLSAPKSVLLLPCRHLSVCEDCLAGFQQQKCPVCRGALEDYCVFEKQETDKGIEAAQEEAKQQQEQQQKED